MLQDGQDAFDRYASAPSCWRSALPCAAKSRRCCKCANVNPSWSPGGSARSRWSAAVERAAAAQSLDTASLIIHADKRDVSMKTILATVKYHAEREYPYLIVQNDQYSPMTLQAINLNDRYLIMQLAKSVEATS